MFKCRNLDIVGFNYIYPTIFESVTSKYWVNRMSNTLNSVMFVISRLSSDYCAKSRENEEKKRKRANKKKRMQTEGEM